MRTAASLFELTSDRKVERHTRNENGDRIGVAIGIGAVLAVLALSYGFSLYDPRTPASDELIEKMDEIGIT